MHTQAEYAVTENRKCDETIERQKEEKRVIGLSPKHCLGGVRTRENDAQWEGRTRRDFCGISGVISAIPKFGKMVVCCSSHTSNVE